MASREIVGGYPEGTGSEETHRHNPTVNHNAALPTLGRGFLGSAASCRRVEIAGVLTLVLVVALMFIIRSTDVHVFADGATTTVSSRSADDAAVVEQAGVALEPGDVVEEDGGTLTVHRAKEIALGVDGRSYEIRTQAATVADVLLEAGISLGPLDSLRLNGAAVTASSELGSAPSTLDVRRAVPVTVVENGRAVEAQSSGDTVGELLSGLDIELGPGDVVRPAPESTLSAGMRVQVDHARQLVVTLPDHKAVLYTQEASVGPAIANSSLSLPADFRLEPAETTQISAGLAVRVVGISQDHDLETTRIESQTIYQPDPSLPAGATRTIAGQDGVLYRQYQEEYEDGTLVSRTLAQEWYDPQPVDTIIYYSTAPAASSIGASAASWADMVCAYDWDCDWALAVIQCESGGNPDAYNPAGYVGLFQIWEGNGPNLRDPATNIAAAYSLYTSGGRSPWPNCP